jgi:hypothetical protein
MNCAADVSPLCWDCVNSKSEGEFMVGSDATGGGPEEFVSCKKGHNQIALRIKQFTCPDRITWNDEEDY